MIAKAKSIAHGSISIDYITRLGEAEIIALNHLPDDVESSAWYYDMMLHQKTSHQLARGRPLKNSIIRIEICPSRDESVNFTHRDWEILVWDTLKAMDAINLSRKGGRKTAGKTNLSNSQFIATLHRDSKSGILHLHIDINRVDMNGNINDDSFIGRRAAMAANEVARQRGWIQAEEKSKVNITKISKDCYDVLKNMKYFSWATYQSALSSKGYDIQIRRDSHNQVRGYSIRLGNSLYKASELGKGRNLTTSRIEATWRRLHNAEVSRFSTSTSLQRPMWVSGQHSVIFPQASRVARPLDAPQMMNRSFVINDQKYDFDVPSSTIEAINDEVAKFQTSTETAERITDIALLLAMNYVKEAISYSETHGGGGGGGSSLSGWGRRKDDDDERWLRRCARTAHQIVTTPKFKRGRGR